MQHSENVYKYQEVGGKADWSECRCSVCEKPAPTGPLYGLL